VSAVADVERVIYPSEVVEKLVYRYDGPLRWATGENIELVRRGGIKRGWRVLDVGAGTGYLSIPLAEVVGPDGTVVCADCAPQMQAAVEQKAARRGLSDRLRYETCNALGLPFPPDGFDAVFCSYLLHELGDDAHLALEEMHRVLRANQPIVIADYRRLPDPERTAEVEAWYAVQREGTSPGELRLRFTLEELESMLSTAGFRRINIASWNEFHMHADAIK
jgi:ubiquinone/menaquinone biosynthesis C-methylase UbiE